MKLVHLRLQFKQQNDLGFQHGAHAQLHAFKEIILADFQIIIYSSCQGGREH